MVRASKLVKCVWMWGMEDMDGLLTMVGSLVWGTF